jgi:hypothetical protein
MAGPLMFSTVFLNRWSADRFLLWINLCSIYVMANIHYIGLCFITGENLLLYK